MPGIIPNRYNFSLATLEVINFYGTNPMNCFFMSAMLTGFPSGSPYSQDRTFDAEQAYVDPQDNPEGRFWTAVRDCYCMTETHYKTVIGLVFSAARDHCDQGELEFQVNNLKDGFISDLEFFDIRHGKERGANVDEHCKEMAQGEKLHFILGEIQNWVNDDSTYQEQRNYQTVAQGINNRNGDEVSKTLLKAFRTALSHVPYTEGTGGSSMEVFGVQLMYKNENLQSEVAHINSGKFLNFGATTYSQYASQALWIQWQANTEAYQGVVDRWLAWLFYLNFNDVFKKYLSENGNHIVNPHASRDAFKHLLQPGAGSVKPLRITAEDREQLVNISAPVLTWDTYKALSQGEVPARPAVEPIKKKKTTGSS